MKYDAYTELINMNLNKELAYDLSQFLNGKIGPNNITNACNPSDTDEIIYWFNNNIGFSGKFIVNAFSGKILLRIKDINENLYLEINKDSFIIKKIIENVKGLDNGLYIINNNPKEDKVFLNYYDEDALAFFRKVYNLNSNLKDLDILIPEANGILPDNSDFIVDHISYNNIIACVKYYVDYFEYVYKYTDKAKSDIELVLEKKH